MYRKCVSYPEKDVFYVVECGCIFASVVLVLQGVHVLIGRIGIETMECLVQSPCDFSAIFSHDGQKPPRIRTSGKFVQKN